MIPAFRIFEDACSQNPWRLTQFAATWQGKRVGPPEMSAIFVANIKGPLQPHRSRGSLFQGVRRISWAVFAPGVGEGRSSETTVSKVRVRQHVSPREPGSRGLVLWWMTYSRPSGVNPPDSVEENQIVANDFAAGGRQGRRGMWRVGVRRGTGASDRTAAIDLILQRSHGCR